AIAPSPYHLSKSFDACSAQRKWQKPQAESATHCHRRMAVAGAGEGELAFLPVLAPDQETAVRAHARRRRSPARSLAADSLQLRNTERTRNGRDPGHKAGPAALQNARFDPERNAPRRATAAISSRA